MNKLQCTCRTYFTNEAQTMICAIPFINWRCPGRVLTTWNEVSVTAVLCCGTLYPKMWEKLNQSGNKGSTYLPTYSMETSLYEQLMLSYSGIDEKKITTFVLLDASKAFYPINRGIVLNNLLDIGISPSSVVWLTSYVLDRWHVVCINSELCDPLPVVSRRATRKHSWTHFV